MTTNYIPTTDDAKDISKVIKEISNSMARAEGERTYQGEAKKQLAEDYGIDKKVIAQLVKIYHKQNAETQFAENEELQMIYDKCFK